MPDITKPRRSRIPAVAPAEPKPPEEPRVQLSEEPARVSGRKKKPAAASLGSDGAETGVVLVPAAPESKKTGGAKRKRLSKAFSRPLDKKLKKSVVVRERFLIPRAEYVQFGLLKNRLSDQGMSVKKSELVRAGLVLLSSLGDDDLMSLMATVPPVA